MKYKIQIQTPVLPSHEAIAKLLPVLRKTVRDSKADVRFFTGRPGCEFYVTVISRDNCEQDELAIDCQKALFDHLFSHVQ